MEVVIASVLNAVSYIVVAAIGVIGGRRSVGPSQDKLITTLKDLVDAQELKIQALEEGKSTQDEKIASLERQVVELKALTIFQAKEIERLSARG